MSPAQVHDLIEQLYDEHRGAVLAFARSRNYDLADDVVSETFAVAMRRADAIPVGNERIWLIGVADKVLRNLQRKEQRAASLPVVLEPYSATTSAPHEPATVGPALSGLPETERAVLTLTAFEGLSSAEAGERLGLSPGSTRNAMVRARRNLALRLAAVGVLLLVPFIFFLLRDRAADTAPQAQQLADALDRADEVTTEVLVTTAGAEPRRYRVTVDQAAGVQRIALPEGLTARGPVGEPARVAPKAGTSAAERRRAQLANAPALRALQTITSGDLERFLQQARRAGAAADTSGTGRGQVTVLRGPITTSDGRRVELRVVLGGQPAELRQLRVRPAGDAAAPWTTVDVAGWSVRLPGSSAARRPSAVPRDTPTEQPGGSERGSTGADDGSLTTDLAPSPERAPRERRGGDGVEPRTTSSVDRETAARNRATLASVPTYTGETGPVVHTRSVTVSTSVQTSTGRASRTETLERESWSEIGGGRRDRQITRALAPSSGRLLRVTERWSSPRVFAELPRPGGTDPATPDAALFCRPTTVPAGPSPEQRALTQARAGIGDLSSGPELRGRPTRLFVFASEPVATAPSVTPPRVEYLLDAETGVPLRRTYRGFGVEEIVVRTDYSVWEERPAGGPAAELAGETPARFRLGQAERCTTPLRSSGQASPTG